MQPTAGEISEGGHVLPLRVYFEDTDASGIVYNASYVRFFERGRTDFLRLLGIEQGARLRGGQAGGYFAVRRLEIDYLSPAFLDDALVVSTRLLAVRGASLDIGQLIRRDQTEIAGAFVKVAFLDQNGRPSRLPGSWRDKMLPYLEAKPVSDPKPVRGAK